MTINLRVGDAFPDFELPDHGHTHWVRFDHSFNNSPRALPWASAAHPAGRRWSAPRRRVQASAERRPSGHLPRRS